MHAVHCMLHSPYTPCEGLRVSGCVEITLFFSLEAERLFCVAAGTELCMSLHTFQPHLSRIKPDINTLHTRYGALMQ